uniref:Uncharacterized protein n=1 Tax=Ochrobactrum sp. LM19 TaxID=1449781 RepID=A0A0D5A172_9HYPH|nr:DUF992 domain-containing protein [Ochrobactrum sp. LM19]AJW30040.1 hypothetical protein pLM19O2_p95 [Ochrobactrum sp. LM19]
MWAVLPTGSNKAGSYLLEGSYVGTSAGASLGIGVGANILVGGSNKSIGLQPLSLEGSQGVNLAVGISKLELTKMPATEKKKAKKKLRQN